MALADTGRIDHAVIVSQASLAVERLVMVVRPPTGDRSHTLALGTAYAGAVLIGPLSWFVLWVAAFGYGRAVEPATVSAIPGWIAVAVPPVLGIALGYRAADAPRRLRWTYVVAPAIPLGLALIAYVSGGNGAESILRSAGLVALYAFGPVVLGRFLRLVSDRVRRRHPESAATRRHGERTDVD